MTGHEEVHWWVRSTVGLGSRVILCAGPLVHYKRTSTLSLCIHPPTSICAPIIHLTLCYHKWPLLTPNWGQLLHLLTSCCPVHSQLEPEEPAFITLKNCWETTLHLITRGSPLPSRLSIAWWADYVTPTPAEIFKCFPRCSAFGPMVGAQSILQNK